MHRFKRLQEQAYDYIREQIIEGHLDHSVIYSETQMAKEIGISRTPVRDAIQRLNQEGIVDIYPSKGFSLHVITETDIVETYQIRSALESYCVQLMTHDYKSERAQQSLAAMRKLVEEQSGIRTPSKEELVRFAEKDQQFHSTIIGYANNKTFDEIFQNQMYRIKTLTVNSLAAPGRIQDTLREHRQIIDAIGAGNLAKCGDIAIAHLDNLKDLVLQMLQG